MKVRKDFGKRMTALADELPRDAVAALLTRLAPTVPVNVRPPKAEHKPELTDIMQEAEARFRRAVDAQRAPHAVQILPPLRGVDIDQLFDGGKPVIVKRLRRRSPKNSDRLYKTLVPGAHFFHRKGTWTRAMVKCALAEGSTLAAEHRLRADYPQYDHKMIDWHWLSEVKGYIQF